MMIVSAMKYIYMHSALVMRIYLNILHEVNEYLV